MSSNLYDKTTHKLIPIAGNSESTAASLGSLSDVVITSPTNGQHLTFDLATSQWKNADAPLPTIEVNDLSDVTIISVSNGQILKWNSTTTKWENSSFNDITSLGAIPNVDISQVQDGDILVYDTTSGKWINTALDMSDYQTKNLSSSVESASTVEGALGALSSNKMSWSDNSVLGAKNLLLNDTNTQTIGGITFTVNTDGSVIANGTASTHVWLQLNQGFKLDAKDYVLTGCPSGGGANTYEVQFRSTEADSSQWQMVNDFGEGAIGIGNPSRTYIAFVGVHSGQTVTNLIFRPMLRLATDNDDTYEPYSMTNQQITPYVQSISNPNLLDNPWFTVNQRGLSSYSGASIEKQYTFDRWMISWAPSSVSVTKNADGTITYTNNSSRDNVQLLQPIDSPKMLANRQVTLSIDVVAVTGNVQVALTLNSSPWTAYVNQNVSQAGIHSKSGICGDFSSLVDGDVKVLIGLDSGESITVRAVKLELGSVSTLAMDTAPNYQQELAKCQRYYTRFSWSSGYPDIAWGVETATDQFWGFITTPVPMRNKPSVTMNGLQAYKPALETAVSITAVAVGSYTSNKLKLLFTESSNGVVGTMAEVQLADNAVGEAYIAFSADL